MGGFAGITVDPVVAHIHNGMPADHACRRHTPLEARVARVRP